MPPPLGARVKVPFRKKELIGIVVGLTEKSECPVEKLRMVTHSEDDESIISEKQMLLYRWISRYYHAPLSDVLALALPNKFRLGSPLDLGISKTDQKEEQQEPAPLEQPKQLNSEQQESLNAILKVAEEYHCFLLQGITGSGKTEVYLQAVQAVLEKGKQVLILVPEIGLTPQLFTRFQRRFSPYEYPIVLLHSALNDTERWQAWSSAHKSKASIIIGTRSAIFTPIPQLGLIIVDEEHDASFKQQDSLRYSARDMAVMRAQMSQVPIVLGSATPSLETLHNAMKQKYTLLRLTQRAAKAQSPTVQLIDMRQQKAKQGLSLFLLEEIKKRLQSKEQVLIFVNRRGYAPVLLCHGCGWMAQCNHCSARLTLHSKKKILQCHHCDATQPVPTFCKQCGKESLVPVGVGTERLEETLQQHFPDANVLRVDKDTTRRKNSFKEKLEQIHQGEVDILIGTQMLAKGHHFANLTLVAMINIDQGFFHHDFRASEKIGQLILQVAGRAGREEKPGKVIIQTHVPDYPPLVTLLRDGYTSFSHHILSERQETGFPPFGHLALFRCQSKSIEEARHCLEKIKAALLSLNDSTILVLGPAPSPMEKKAGVYRMQLLVTAEDRSSLARAISSIRRHKLLIPTRIRLSIDIDPVDLS
jgi:primosomal protein N' (replication factor Y)